jgi:hypothetical protein
VNDKDGRMYKQKGCDVPTRQVKKERQRQSQSDRTNLEQCESLLAKNSGNQSLFFVQYKNLGG